MIQILYADGQSNTVLMDSISYVTADSRGAIVISGSHGGTSSARYALDARVAAAFFNDAGGGKNGAGIAGLAMLDQEGIIAAAVSHQSAEIGNARDTWQHGIIAHVNRLAAAAGIRLGLSVAEAVDLLR